MLVLASVFGDGLKMDMWCWRQVCGLCSGEPVLHNAKPLREKYHKKKQKNTKSHKKVFHKKLKSLLNSEFDVLKKNSKQQKN